MRDVVVIVSSVAIIMVCVAVLELVFQRRLIEILDRFLSRSMADYAGAQQMLKSQVQELFPYDDETDRDEQALKEAKDSLENPVGVE